jgi:hypothetical protein
MWNQNPAPGWRWYLVLSPLFMNDINTNCLRGAISSVKASQGAGHWCVRNDPEC